MSITSERLLQILREKGVSLRELADQTGISKSSLGYYANGSRSIPLDKLEDIANILGVSAIWLIGWSDRRDGKLEPAQPVQKDELPEEKFVRMFIRLSSENQQRILDLMQVLLKAEEVPVVKS